MPDTKEKQCRAGGEGKGEVDWEQGHVPVARLSSCVCVCDMQSCLQSRELKKLSSSLFEYCL